MMMDSTSRILDSDNESDSDILELHNDDDFDKDEDQTTTAATSTTTVNQNIGSVWRDLVVGEQMEGCLTRLEVTNKTESYTDMDDPNYQPTNNGYKRKRAYSSIKSNQKTDNISDNEYDLESNHVVKKRFSLGNGNVTKYNYKYENRKGFVEKMKNNDSKTYSRILPVICDSEEKPMDWFVEELCTNLHEHNTTLMSSVTSKIDRKIILDKYNKTCLIEANGGQMIKNGNRRRTSGGIFFNLIKEDKSIPNAAKKDLFCSSQNEEIKKKKKREKMKRRKESLKRLIAMDKKKADHLNMLNEELETLQSQSSSLLENEDLSL